MLSAFLITNAIVLFLIGSMWTHRNVPNFIVKAFIISMAFASFYFFHEILTFSIDSLPET